MSIRMLAWHTYRSVVVPSYVRESDIFENSERALWKEPKPEYAWIMMKALLLFKMELKDKPWMCGELTLRNNIDYIQKIIDSVEVK